MPETGWIGLLRIPAGRGFSRGEWNKAIRKSKIGLCAETHICNPSYSGGGDQGPQVEVSLGKKLLRHPSQQTSRAWGFMVVIPATQEVEIGGSWSETSPGQKCETSSEK
jgi:hypothetical protein